MTVLVTEKTQFAKISLKSVKKTKQKNQTKKNQTNKHVRCTLIGLHCNDQLKNYIINYKHCSHLYYINMLQS